MGAGGPDTDRLASAGLVGDVEERTVDGCSGHVVGSKIVEFGSDSIQYQ